MFRRTCLIASLTAVWLGAASAADTAAAGFELIIPHITWDSLFIGSRAEGMGQAVLADDDQPTAILDGAAPFLTGQTVAFSYGRLEYIAGLEVRNYALAVEVGAARLGFARMDLLSDDIDIRNAYDTDLGTFRIDDRVNVVSGCFDVAQLLAPQSPWEWIFGASYRAVRLSSPDNVDHEGSADIGSSARWRHEYGGARLSLAVSGAVRNIERSEYLPRTTRFGTALKLGFDGLETRDAIVVTIAYAKLDNQNSGKYFEDDNFGLELSLLGIVAARYGHDSKLFDGTREYGFGLAVPPRLLAGVALTCDWASMSVDSPVTDESELQMWTAGASCRF